jgi:Protein of unknown function (DUF4256)
MNKTELLTLLETRFEKHRNRHPNIQWKDVLERLEAMPEKIEALHEMEETGGEPDVVGKDETTGQFLFFDCAAESPKGRRSLCYDSAALEERKEAKPAGSAVQWAIDRGLSLLDEQQYRYLQTLGKFDAKTSSWLATPAHIRALGGAIFGDYRFDTVFVYHNGVQSYYAGRAFRTCLKV